MELLATIFVWAVPVVLAITLHEAAHAWMASRFGDDTAKRLGRLSFNPFRHVDRVGTILLPGLLLLVRSPVLFGYAKPVPVNFQALTPRRKGMFMVAIAGPATNIALAVISALLLHLENWITPEEAPLLFQMLYISLNINCVLAVLNMFPILPLDGGRVMAALLPSVLSVRYARLEKYGFFIILTLLFAPMLVGVNLPGIIIGEPAFWVVEQILRLTGSGG